jgi:outer membrane murein-binding lipoprotein Lpp
MGSLAFTGYRRRLELMSDDSRTRGIIAYNTALRAAQQNLSCLEATLKVGTQKADIRTLTRRCLAGAMSQQELLLQDSFNEACGDLDKILADHESRHRSVLSKMDSDAADERHRLQQEMDRANQRIQAARETSERAREAISTAQDVPRFDADAIGDIDRLRQDIEASKQTVARLEGRLRNAKPRPRETIPDILKTLRSPTVRIRDRQNG